MRSFFLTAAALPAVVLGCSNPDTDACAGAFVSSSAAASSFCATWTADTITATTGVPAVLGSACANKTKKLSSACTCYVTGGAAAPTSAVVSVETSSVVKVSTSTPAAATSVKATSVKATSVKATSVAETTLATSVKPATTTVAADDPTGGTTCTVTAYADIASAVASCTDILLSGISAPASSTIDLQSLQTGTTVTFAGKTTFGTTADSDFDPMVISGHDITITGAAGHTIDGNGAAYWDGEGSNGGSDKPDHFIVVKKVYNGIISNLNIQNWPTHCFYINGVQGLSVTGLVLDNSAGDEPNSASGSEAAAHNSDGFDISSSDDVILDNIKVYNQDDCVAVTSGTAISVSNMYCSGGHGLSIGSIGGKSNNTVSGVTFSDSTVVNSQNGCRIKSNSGTTGTIENIVYSNITMSGITNYGIDVQQDYLNGGPTGEPTNGVTIKGISFNDITGTATDDAYNYYILCGDGSCSDFSFSGVSITGGGETSTCNYPSTGCPA
ncbi:glycosyl hydrolases family 28-domain-containing protein [Pseudomassariella vexata]|uniref:endo-polygalacturonase n=1 Tax=Pseudomassariella vexata TaxID=1141098 RepID=A0A1Y2E9X3_9PEZI|nr:glycosyl hydrolases family 28-domain-containing protein [Pseudomassariella vexata]ORY68342.1 glycosyl hydrolases family 28-domain-containing protein [Pseudomassariella vexata]